MPAQALPFQKQRTRLFSLQNLKLYTYISTLFLTHKLYRRQSNNGLVSIQLENHVKYHSGTYFPFLLSPPLGGNQFAEFGVLSTVNHCVSVHVL